MVKTRRKDMGALASTTYEEDIAAWMSQQLAYLKAGEYDKIDMDNFIDEAEGVVRTDKRSMKSYFVILMGHLLKIQYQPSKKTKSWYYSVDNSRLEINGILSDSPSLKSYMPLAFEQAWEQARKLAISETNMSTREFPRSCPWDLDYVMNKKINIEDFR